MTAELALAPSQPAIRRLDGISDGEAAAGVRTPTIVLGRVTTSLRRLCVTRLRRAQLHQITLDPWGDLVGGATPRAGGRGAASVGDRAAFSLAGRKTASHRAK